jgi:hypothetical protein
MSKTVEHIDEYGDRYVTSINNTSVGVEIITQIYSIRPFLNSLKIRRNENSVEVYGTISTDFKLYDTNNILIVKNYRFEEDWIEIWNKCVDSRNKDTFKHNLNNFATSQCSPECKVGSFLVDVEDNDEDVVWGDIIPSGSIIFKYDENQVLFKFIDVWDDSGDSEDRLFNTFFPYQFSFNVS